MSWIEAIILGIVQGLTEFLPVSSSGHLELGKALLGVDSEKSLIFTVVLHGATVLSTIVVFRKEILMLFRGLFLFRWNDETRYLLYIAVSMVPAGFVFVFLKDQAESLFNGNLVLVGTMLLLTGVLLLITRFVKAGERPVKGFDAFIIGIAQAIAILPGLSRSGATITTGLFLGNKREEVTRFSFLMVLIPVIGDNILSLLSGEIGSQGSIPPAAFIAGFIAAFLAGLVACRWMIKIVSKGNLGWFALYCFIVGIIAITFGII
jgi:undecaprenyl-diphosphatase